MDDNLRDRGNMKWRGFMMPEHLAMLARTDWDGHRQAKPIPDEYEIVEMESRIHFAQECKLPVRITEHIGGLPEVMTGVVEKVDAITKEVFVRVGDYVERVKWADIIGVEVVDG